MRRERHRRSGARAKQSDPRYADRSKVWLAQRMAPDRYPGCPGAPPANVRGHSTPITLATGERFSPTRFSLTGAHSTRGIHPQRPARRAAKRKTLYVITDRSIGLAEMVRCPISA